MSFLKILFSQKEEDFETVLAALAKDIEKRQIKLLEIRLREKRSTLLATIYTLFGWVAYTTLWYLDILPSLFRPTAGRPAIVERAMRGLPVFVGPIIILFIRRIVQVWYTRKADAEEKALQNLMKQRRIKVDDIKKKTNFDSMVKLFQEYDELPRAKPLRERVMSRQDPVTPRRQDAALGRSSMPPTLQAQLTPVPIPFPMGPPRKRWYDKVADALLGDEDHDMGTPSSRYALICERCFTHNGLVKESMWEDAKFVCRNPACNHFNRSVRSKRESSSLNSSPCSSASPSPDTLPNFRRPSRGPSHRSHQVPPVRRNSFAPPVHSSDPDAPTVDFMDTSQMEVDS
ncbi:hypothetical protein Ac2012v2_004516 [Leucoagaricus gongylophorus]